MRGRIVEEFYDDAGICVERIEVSPNAPVCALNIPAGAWHTLQSLESGTVILEMKDGAYEPIVADDILTVGQKASDDSKVQYCVTAIDVHS